MGSTANRTRVNWQTLGGAVAATSEKDVFDVFDLHFQGTDFEIEKHPKEFKKIYSKKEVLDKKTLSEIFTPPKLVKKDKKGKVIDTFPFGYGNHGISPDFAITNIKTKKTLYGEIKKQDGWTGACNKHKATKDNSACNPPKHHKHCSINMAAGRGNVHERMCKLFTPGILTRMKKIGKLKAKLPFWVIVTGPITLDPKRNRELAIWFEGNEEHFFMWRDQTDATELVSHFNKNFKKLLEQKSAKSTGNPSSGANLTPKYPTL